MSKARVLLPVSAWSEEEGTYTNFSSIVQRTGAAVRPPGQARPALFAFHLLCTLAGKAEFGASARDVFPHLAAVVPQYSGLTYSSLISNNKKVYPPEGRHAYSAEKA
jgi:formate dehydrogenase major subunit